MLLNNTIVLNDWIANQVRLDFAQGAVVSVEGLAALTNGSARLHPGCAQFKKWGDLKQTQHCSSVRRSHTRYDLTF